MQNLPQDTDTSDLPNAKENYQLAPLYDLITSAPYQKQGTVAKSAMRIKDHYQFVRIGMDACLYAATQLKIDKDRAQEFIEYLRVNAVGSFEEVRDEMRELNSATYEFAGTVVSSVSQLRRLK